MDLEQVENYVEDREDFLNGLTTSWCAKIRPVGNVRRDELETILKDVFWTLLTSVFRFGFIGPVLVREFFDAPDDPVLCRRWTDPPMPHVENEAPGNGKLKKDWRFAQYSLVLPMFVCLPAGEGATEVSAVQNARATLHQRLDEANDTKKELSQLKSTLLTDHKRCAEVQRNMVQQSIPEFFKNRLERVFEGRPELPELLRRLRRATRKMQRQGHY